MLNVIAVGMDKGGVGKTTSSLNLAAEFAFLGLKTLCVDADKQANITKTLLKHLGTKVNSLPQTVCNIFDGAKPIPEKIIHETKHDNLWLIPSSVGLADIITTPPMGFQNAFTRFLKRVWDDFDMIIIDTPPGVNCILTAAMEVSNSIILPIQCEEYCLQGVSEMSHNIAKAQDVLNENLRLLGAFLTMVQKLTFTDFAREEAKNFFKDSLFKTEIRRSVTVTESQNNGLPIRYYDPDSKPAQDYANLAKEVLSRL